jgi:hypothetical protein
MTRRGIWSIAFLAAGCGAARDAARPGAPERVEPAFQPPALPPPAVPQAPVLYPLDEAVNDVLSGPLTHFGTGPWHGNHRVQACAYRNDRVIVVNVYCTIKETRAFRVDVFSPTRGRVRIYAEAKAPPSGLTRKDYFSFTAEAEPPPGPQSGLPPLALAMSFTELRHYDERRYKSFLPACFGGVEAHRPQGGCVRDLAPRAAEWADRNQRFLAQPPEEWCRVVRELRAVATVHGKNAE